jgi:hypothetical protein
VYSGRRIARFTVAVALVLAAISWFWSYWVRADEEAAQFTPLRIQPETLPAGMAIQAVIKHGIRKSTEKGDVVTALVSKPVVMHDRLVIPSGAQLKGDLEDVSVLDGAATAKIHFNVLLTGGNAIAIQTRQIVITTPIRSDIQTVSKGLKTIVGASLGAAVGAASGDPRVVSRGLIEGAVATTSAGSPVPITVILTRDLEM